MTKSFWKNKKVLVTGHTGFKGSWLSIWLNLLGAEVIGLSLNPPTKKNLYDKAKVSTKVLSLRGDIRDYIRFMFLNNTTNSLIISYITP